MKTKKLIAAAILLMSAGCFYSCAKSKNAEMNPEPDPLVFYYYAGEKIYRNIHLGRTN